MAAVSKTAGSQGPVGSNPTSTAIVRTSMSSGNQAGVRGAIESPSLFGNDVTLATVG